MSCTDFEQFLAEYVDGLLPSEQATKVETHLAGCDACRHEVELARFGKENLAEMPAPEAPADLTGRIIDATTQKSSWLVQLKQWFAQVPAPAYALLLIAVAASVLVYRMPGVDKGFMEQAPDAPMLAKYKEAENEKDKPATAAPAAVEPDQLEGKEAEVPIEKSVVEVSPKPVVSKKGASKTKSADHSGEKNGLLGMIGSSADGSMAGAGGAGPSPSADISEELSAPKISDTLASGRKENVDDLRLSMKPMNKSAPMMPAEPREKTLYARSRRMSKKSKGVGATTISTGMASGEVVIDQPPYMDETLAEVEGEDIADEISKDKKPKQENKRAGGMRFSESETAHRMTNSDKADEDSGVESKALRIVGRYDGIRSGLTRRRTILITSQSRLAKIWAQIWAKRINPPPLPYVDFSRQIAVVYSLGTQTTGGYALRITSVDRVGNTLRARVAVKRPTKGTGLTQALTQPYSLVVVEVGSGSREGLKIKAIY